MRHALALALLALSAGCLSSTHYISKQELRSIAYQPPEQRGRSVHVVQGFIAEETPPEPCCNGGGGVYVGGGHSHGYGGGGGGGGGVRPKAAASGNIDDARAAIVLLAVATVALAATEGARYNGWVGMSPAHPVHLIGPYGEYARVAIADLDPETAAWARKAYVREQDGGWQKLGRAPLDRRGLTWGMLLGTAEIGGAGGLAPGFMSHLQIGGFPTQEVGLVFDLGLGWRDEDMADAVYQISGHGELQLLPLAAGKIHAGGYALLGTVARSDDGAGRDTSSTLWGGGGLVQIDLTTYLALTGRAGVTYLFDERANDLTVGLSIY